MATEDSWLSSVELPLNAPNLIQVLRAQVTRYDRQFHEYAEHYAQVSTEIAVRRYNGLNTEESDAAYHLRRENFEHIMTEARGNEIHEDFDEILEVAGYQPDPIVQPDLPMLPRLPPDLLDIESMGVDEIRAKLSELNHVAEQMNGLERVSSLMVDNLRDISRLVAALRDVLGIYYDEGAPPARPFDVATLPKIIVTESILKGNLSVCIICLNDLQLLEEVTQLPCDHMAWHSDCIAMWIGHHGRTTCPYCRKELARE